MTLAQHINPIHPRNFREWQLQVDSGSFSYQFPVSIRGIDYTQEEVQHRINLVGDLHQYYVPIHRTGGRLKVRTNRIEDLEAVRDLFHLSSRMQRDAFDVLGGDFDYTPPPPQTVILISGRHKLTFGRCFLASYEINPADQFFLRTDYVAHFEWIYQSLSVEEDDHEVTGYRMNVARDVLEPHRFVQEWLQTPPEEWRAPEPPPQIVRNEWLTRWTTGPWPGTASKKTTFPERYTDWQELGF